MKVYLLKFKELNKEGYIGITDRTLKLRLRGHLGDSKRSKTKKSKWLKRNIDKGYTLEIKLLKNVENYKAYRKERQFIRRYKRWGWKLFNSTIGGKGFSSKHSNKTKKKISLANKGIPLKIETRIKMSLISKGVKKSKKHCENISKGRKGIKFTDEHKANIKKNHVGRRGMKATKEEIEKRSGKNHYLSKQIIGKSINGGKDVKYESINQAYKDLLNKGHKTSHKSISRSIHDSDDNKRSSGGYKWYTIN